jgi:hypothetical protein
MPNERLESRLFPSPAARYNAGMTPVREFIPTDHTVAPEDLVSLLCEPLPSTDVIVASAGEWRREADGRWRWWQAQEWIDD